MNKRFFDFIHVSTELVAAIYDKSKEYFFNEMKRSSVDRVSIEVGEDEQNIRFWFDHPDDLKGDCFGFYWFRDYTEERGNVYTLNIGFNQFSKLILENYNDNEKEEIIRASIYFRDLADKLLESCE